MGIDHISFPINSEDALREVCVKLVPCLSSPMMIGLTGDMGSGKTTLVRTICELLHCSDWVNSPTYSIIQRYDSPTFDILHIDLYRLTTEMDIDLLDIPSQLTDHTIAFIEWMDNTTQLHSDVTIHLSCKPTSDRHLTISTSNENWIRQLK